MVVISQNYMMLDHLTVSSHTITNCTTLALYKLLTYYTTASTLVRSGMYFPSTPLPSLPSLVLSEEDIVAQC